MRKLFLSLSLAAASSLFAGSAFAQDKPLPPADQPAQPDKAKDLQKDLQKDQKDLPAQPDKKPQIDPNRDIPNPNRTTDVPVKPGSADKPAQDRPTPAVPDRTQPTQPAQPNQGAGASGGARANVQTQRVSGKIVSANNGMVVIRTDAGKEITLNSAAQTHFMIDGRPARLADFRTGSTINAAYFMDRDRMVLDTLAIGDLPAAPAPAVPASQPTLLQGTVVKVVGTDQMLIRTAEGKEVLVNVSPQTKIELTAQGGTLADVQPMMPVQVWYDVIDRRPIVRTLRPWRR